MKIGKIFKVLVLGLLVGLGVFVAVNYRMVVDFVLGVGYTPSAEMALIREKLDLTARGEFLFNASRPELESQEEFNVNCLSFDEATAVLGCYTEQRIYVYDIRSEELSGINELTTAHELLHAVYERMSESERESLREDLEKVYRENQAVLAEEISGYTLEAQLEEMYVRIGTEVRDLPERLEKHYAEIFKEQDKIVGFYESYIKVFRELEARFRQLEAEMENLMGQIEQKTSEYEAGVLKLNNEILEFNNCAEEAGCFQSEYEFSVRRALLVNRQNELRALYAEIDGMINEYNAKVLEYNNNVIRQTDLQNIINSHVRVEGL